MAQTRIFEYEADDSTYQLNQQGIAQVPPGRYRGFDFDNTSAGLNLVLSHTATGVVLVNQDQTYTNPSGIIRTQQGVEIREDAAVSITVVANTGNADPRIDLVVAEHEYVEVTGGQAASYVVIQGTPGATPADPALTSPKKQTVIGKIYWPGTVGNITAATYTKALAPHFNGEIYHYTNVFMEPATYNSGTSVISGAVASNMYYLPNSGAAYVSVSGFDFPVDRLGVDVNEVAHLHIYTAQALRLVNGGNIDLGVGSYVHIPANTVFSVVNVKGTSLGAGVSKYVFIRGSEPKADRAHKNFAQFVMNQGVPSIASGDISLDGKGNYYDLVVSTTGLNINRMQSTDSMGDSTLPLTRGGGLVYLRINDGSNTVPATLKNGIASGSGMKGFLTGLTADVPVYSGDTLVFIETQTNYTLIGQYGPVVNPIKLYQDYHALTQTEEKVYTKTRHLGATNGTTYDAGTFTLTVDNNGNTITAAVPVAGLLRFIKLQRGSSVIDFPNGSIITIHFVQTWTTGQEPFALDVASGTSNIRSSIDDSSRNSGGSGGILHTSPATPDADIYTFRRDSGVWRIVAMPPQPDVYAKLQDLYSKLSIEAWKLPTYAAGYAGYSPNPLKFRKNVAGEVRFSGAVTLPSGWTSGAVMFTLPTAYRPAADEQFLAADNSGISPAVFFIGADGTARIYSSINLANRSIYGSSVRFDV